MLVVPYRTVVSYAAVFSVVTRDDTKNGCVIEQQTNSLILLLNTPVTLQKWDLSRVTSFQEVYF